MGKALCHRQSCASRLRKIWHSWGDHFLRHSRWQDNGRRLGRITAHTTKDSDLKRNKFILETESNLSHLFTRSLGSPISQTLSIFLRGFYLYMVPQNSKQCAVYKYVHFRFVLRTKMSNVYKYVISSAPIINLKPLHFRNIFITEGNVPSFFIILLKCRNCNSKLIQSWCWKFLVTCTLNFL